jgi:hypothetical protein
MRGVLKEAMSLYFALAPIAAGACERPERGKGRRKARLSALDQIADIGASRYLHHRRALD